MRYWTKIGLGALGVFCLGIVTLSAAKTGLAQLKTVAAAPVQRALQNAPAQLLNFRLDGRRIGKIKSLEVASQGDWNADAVAMTVAVAEGREVDLADCGIASESRSHRRDAAFRCVTAADVADEGLTQIGEVRFEPAGITRPLYVERHQYRELQRSEIRGLKGQMTSPDGETVTGNAEFDIQSNGKRERGTVKIDAGDGRAVIEVRGENGQELFRLRADDRGVSINATDKRGSSLMRLLAGETGVKIDVQN